MKTRITKAQRRKLWTLIDDYAIAKAKSRVYDALDDEGSERQWTQRMTRAETTLAKYVDGLTGIQRSYE